MHSGRKRFLALVLSCLALLQSASARTRPDLTKEPTLYVVGYAHLDTQWRWEYPQVVNEYLPNTMRDNFALFEKYPNYLFNFTGVRFKMARGSMNALAARGQTLKLPVGNFKRLYVLAAATGGNPWS
ncbi:MAG TPA: hypothetical protein VF297_00825 [Pyrinomonadaceae bacterium]